jgi:hypothetical protein
MRLALTNSETIFDGLLRGHPIPGGRIPRRIAIVTSSPVGPLDGATVKSDRAAQQCHLGSERRAPLRLVALLRLIEQRFP